MGSFCYLLPVIKRECALLFIGTQFSDLYTAVDCFLHFLLPVMNRECVTSSSESVLFIGTHLATSTPQWLRYYDDVTI